MFIYKQNTNTVNFKDFFYEEIKEIGKNSTNIQLLHALVNESIIIYK